MRSPSPVSRASPGPDPRCVWQESEDWDPVRSTPNPDSCGPQSSPVRCPVPTQVPAQVPEAPPPAGSPGASGSPRHLPRSQVHLTGGGPRVRLGSRCRRRLPVRRTPAAAASPDAPGAGGRCRGRAPGAGPGLSRHPETSRDKHERRKGPGLVRVWSPPRYCTGQSPSVVQWTACQTHLGSYRLIVTRLGG